MLFLNTYVFHFLTLRLLYFSLLSCPPVVSSLQFYPLLSSPIPIPILADPLSFFPFFSETFSVVRYLNSDPYLECILGILAVVVGPLLLLFAWATYIRAPHR